MSTKPDTTSTPAPTLELLPEHHGKAGLRIRELELYGVKKAKAHDLIRRGKLRAVHLDGCVIVPLAEWEKYLASARPIEPKRGRS